MPGPIFSNDNLRAAILNTPPAETDTQQRTAQPPATGIGIAPYLALGAGSGIDLATTLAALHSGAGREANPLLSHGGDAGLVLGKAASTAGLMLAMHALANHGHPTAAKAIGYIGGAGLGGIAAHNASIGS